MSHVKSIIGRMKSQGQSKISAPVDNPKLNLPGLNRFERVNAETLIARKREYNLQLSSLPKMNKKLKSLKGDKRKDMKLAIVETKHHMQELLSKIGVYTSAERLHGFSGVRDAQ